MKQALGFFFIVLLTSLSGFSDPIQIEDFEAAMVSTRGETRLYEYLAPNEQSPVDSLSLLKVAPRGRGFFVGTERGLIAAGLTDNITGLDLVDFNDQVIAFNSINWVLIKAAQSREGYLHLRLKATFQEWLAAAEKVNHNFAQTILRDEHSWKWWQQATRAVRENSEFQADPSQVKINRNFVEKIEFDQANYLFYDEQFLRVKQLVDRDAIRIAKINLREISQVLTFVNDLSVRKSQYGIVDISNAWQPGYLGATRTSIFLDALTTRMPEDGIFVVTDQTHRELTDGVRRYRKYFQLAWQYAGFTISHVMKFKNTLDFTNHYLPSHRGFGLRAFSNQTTLNSMPMQVYCSYVLR